MRLQQGAGFISVSFAVAENRNKNNYFTGGIIMNELYCSEDRVETLKRRSKRCC